MKIKNTVKKPLIALLLVITLIFSVSNTILASKTYEGKEEVVYANLKYNGKVDEIYVVNIFDKEGKIVDYGEYSKVRNMISNEKITMVNNKITVTNENDKLYYEGKLKNQTLPWNISIKYYLDNKEYLPEDIIGKSGFLKINIDIKENKNNDKNFYNEYALQTELRLDSNKFKDIKTDGATIANVGKDKQFTYTTLPAEGAKISITSDVVEFEMDAINMNGIRLNINADIDESEITGKVNDLNESISKLDNGANNIKDGASTLNDGSDKLVSGANQLKNGSYNLNDGIISLKKGIEEVEEGLNELNDKSSIITNGSSQIKTTLIDIESSLSKVSLSTDSMEKLSSSSSKIKTAIDEINLGIDSLKSNTTYENYKSIMNKNGLDIDNLKGSNSETIKMLNNEINSLTQSYMEIKDVEAYEKEALELKNQIDKFSNILKLIKGNNAAISGTENYLNGLSSSISNLYKGSESLKNQYKLFDQAILELSENLSHILVDMTKLSNGINELNKKYAEFDNGINEYTNGVSEIIDGYSNIVNGANNLALASKSFYTGTNSLYIGTDDLASGINKLYDATEDLAQGTGEFKEGTSDIDVEIENKVDDILSKFTNDDSKTSSFVSSKNKNIKSVQFVIKTKPIKAKEAVQDDDDFKESLNFFQKILKIFGLN